MAQNITAAQCWQISWLTSNKNPKPYWSLLKTFLNNKKTNIIAPLFHENELFTDCKKKAQLLNKPFFGSFFYFHYNLQHNLLFPKL